MQRITRILGAALLIGVAATAVLAGGPNYMFDAANKIPYVWKMEHWPNGQVPYYVDSGNLKNANPLINQTVATNWVIGAFDQWNNVPTSTFRAVAAGRITPDITIANVNQIYPADNGGGIWVVFDAAGTIFRNYLGLPTNVLGYTPVDFYAPDSNEILEVTAFFNGTTVQAADTTGALFAGVFTHEFGHAINLRHSQGNGAVVGIFNETPFPNGCTNQPYPGGPQQGPTVSQVETMYPIINVRAGGTGAGMYTVDLMDDEQAISDLYPAPGWPDNYGKIGGTVRSLTKILGNGSGPTEEIQGVNVIARNLANPYGDFVTTTTGELTRGATVDGTYELHGLTPGATYGVYVDNFLQGSFPTDNIFVLPGPEEWWNGANESGDGTKDDRCAWTGITAAAGTTPTADITFNKVKDSPSWTLLDFPGIPGSASADGSAMVGTASTITGYWMWSTTAGYSEIGGFAPVGGIPAISDDGTKIAGNIKDANGVINWGLYDVPSQTWTLLPPPATTPQNPTCTVSLSGFPPTPSYGVVWGISGDGSTVVGSTNNARLANGTCTKTRATYWRADTGSVLLPKSAPDTNTANHRAESASYDGSVLSGFDVTTTNCGAYWINGVEHFVQGTPNPTPTNFRGEAVHVSRDGLTVMGGTSGSATSTYEWGAYRHDVATGQTETIFTPTTPFIISAFAWTSDDAQNVISGFEKEDNGFNHARLWTPQLGWMDFAKFMNDQGVWMGVDFQESVTGFPQSISADGTIWTGFSNVAGQGNRPWRIEIPKAIVCHVAAGNPHGKQKDLGVTFPGGLAEHLAHGDTLGLCSNGE